MSSRPNTTSRATRETQLLSNPRARDVPFAPPKGGLSRKMQTPRKDSRGVAPPRPPRLPLASSLHPTSELDHPEMPLFSSVTGPSAFAYRKPVIFDKFDPVKFGSFGAAVERERQALIEQLHHAAFEHAKPLQEAKASQPVEMVDIPRTSRPGTGVKEIIALSNAVSRATTPRVATAPTLSQLLASTDSTHPVDPKPCDLGRSRPESNVDASSPKSRQSNRTASRGPPSIVLAVPEEQITPRAMQNPNLVISAPTQPSVTSIMSGVPGLPSLFLPRSRPRPAQRHLVAKFLDRAPTAIIARQNTASNAEVLGSPLSPGVSDGFVSQFKNSQTLDISAEGPSTL